MERKFRFPLIGKEAKRIWPIGVGLLVIATLAILIYSLALYTPTYTVGAGEFVRVDFTPTDKVSLSSDTELRSLYTQINGQSMKDKLNARVKEFRPNIKMPESCYVLKLDNYVYRIDVTMLKESDAQDIASLYVLLIKEQIGSGEYNNAFKAFDSSTFESPNLKSEVGLTPIKMIILGGVGAVAIYFVIVFCVFYFNKKLYNAAEFHDNFSTPILETDVNRFGYHNVAVKLTVQMHTADKPFVVSVGRKMDAMQFAKYLKKEGFSTLYCTVDGALSTDRKVMEVDGLSVLNGSGSQLKASLECKNELKAKYKYDYILIDANDDNLVTAADISDGIILGFDLKKDEYKKICRVFEEISVIKDANVLGVVL